MLRIREVPVWILGASSCAVTVQFSRNAVNCSAPSQEFTKEFGQEPTNVFIDVIDSGKDSALARVTNGFGDSNLIEASLLREVTFGSDIQKYDVISTDKYLIYPYLFNSVISETELQEQYLNAYNYFDKYRDILENRTSIKNSGLRWYELVRKRDENWLQSPKLVIRDLAIETSFAVDILGMIYLVGGTAVVPQDPDMLMPLLAYLNSKLISQDLNQITPLFKQGFQKFEPQHLQKVPVLHELLNKEEFADELTAQAKRILQAKEIGAEGEQRDGMHKVDQMLFQAMGLEESGLLECERLK